MSCYKDKSVIGYVRIVYDISSTFQPWFVLLTTVKISRESLPCNNPFFKHSKLSSHNRAAYKKVLLNLCLIPVTIKCKKKHRKRKQGFQICWIPFNASVINLKKSMEDKQNKRRGFSKMFTISMIFFLKLLG